MKVNGILLNRYVWSAEIPSGGFQRNVTLLHCDRLPSEALCCAKIPSYFEALTCGWRIVTGEPILPVITLRN
jgi:hypothetical protein